MTRDKLTTCPECGAKEESHLSMAVWFFCGSKVLGGEFFQSDRCRISIWQRRAQKAEKKVERLQVMFRLHRRKLCLAVVVGPVRDGAVEEFDAETERIINGESEGA